MLTSKPAVLLARRLSSRQVCRITGYPRAGGNQGSQGSLTPAPGCAQDCLKIKPCVWERCAELQQAVPQGTCLGMWWCQEVDALPCWGWDEAVLPWASPGGAGCWDHEKGCGQGCAHLPPRGTWQQCFFCCFVWKCFKETYLWLLYTVVCP